MLLPGACVVALVVAGSALAHGGPYLSVKTAKQPDGPYALVTPIKIPDGEAKNAYVRVKSKAGAPLGVTLLEDRVVTSGPEYNIKWFKGKTVISHDVQTSGYDFTLKAGKRKDFRARIKAPAGAEPLCLAARTEISGISQPSGYVAVNQGNICDS